MVMILNCLELLLIDAPYPPLPPSPYSLSLVHIHTLIYTHSLAHMDIHMVYKKHCYISYQLSQVELALSFSFSLSLSLSTSH